MRKLSSLFLATLTVMLLVSWKYHTVSSSIENKYSGLSCIKIKNNCVKTTEGKWIAFNMTVSQNKNLKRDRFLVLKEETSFSLIPSASFCIGSHLVLTINGSEKIHLKPCVSGSVGKFSSICPAACEHTVYLSKSILKKIARAENVYFELEGSQYSQMKTVTGYLPREAIQNLRRVL